MVEYFYEGSGVTKVTDYYMRMWRNGFDSDICHYIIKYPENEYYVYFTNYTMITDHENFRPKNYKKLIKFTDCGKDLILQSKFSSVEKDERGNKFDFC